MKKLFTLCAAAILCALTVNLSAADNSAKIIEKIESKNATYATLEFAFDQTRTLANKKQVKMAGTCYYSAKDRMALVYSNPKDDKMIINANMFYMNRSGKEQKFDITKTPSMKSLAYSVLDGVAGKITTFAKDSNMDYTVTEGKNCYIVTLTAKQKGVKGFAKIVLEYRASDCVITRLEMEQFNHVTDVYVPSSIKVNKLIYNTVYNIQ